MRLTITQTDGALPLIPEIPDVGIVRLEGYNGVGKTLTIRLLQVCAGIRPLKGEEWISFCAGLGKVVVTATGLTQDASLKWVTSGERLYGADERDPLSWFDELSLDKKPIGDFASLRRMFDVQRLSGDMGLVETLAQQVRDSAEEVDEFRDRLSADGILSELEQRIELLRQVVQPVQPSVVALRAQTVEDLRKEEARQAEDAEAAATEAEELGALLSLVVKLDRHAKDADDLGAEIGRLDVALASGRERRDALTKELKDKEDAAAKSSELTKKLRKAETVRKRAATSLGNATDALADALALARLRDNQDPLDFKATLEQQIASLAQERIVLDARPAMQSLISELQGPLTGAQTQGLDDQVLLTPTDGPELTVAGVSSGLSRRDAELQKATPPRLATKLDKQLEELRTRVEALAKVPKLQEKAETARSSLQTAEERLGSLTSQLDSTTVTQVEALRKQRTTLEDELFELGGQRRVAQQWLDGIPPQSQRAAMEAQLAAELDSRKIAVADIPTLAEAAEHRRRETSRELSDVRHRSSDVALAYEHDLADLQAVWATLKTTKNFAWVLDDRLPLNIQDLDVADQIATVRTLHHIVNSLDKRITSLTTVLQGTPVTLQAIADKLVGRSTTATFRRTELDAFVAGIAERWFEQHDVRNALLGEDANAIQVTLENMTVQWTAEGALHSQPLQALSSGQQAFVFTQAKLSLLQRSVTASRNRLLALDEFGAFVSQDRLRDLENLLFEWHDAHPNDQLLLVLPAVQDYARLARNSVGEDKNRYSRLAEQLTHQRFFTEPLSRTGR
jgi:hypothetical protein